MSIQPDGAETLWKMETSKKKIYIYDFKQSHNPELWAGPGCDEDSFVRLIQGEEDGV